MKSQKYFAELLGTFFLGFAVSLSLVVDLPIPTPVIAGLTLMVMVYTIGAISGAQINPAVSISLSCVNKQKWNETAVYVVMQLIGGALAFLVVQAMTGVEIAVQNTEGWKIAVAEAVGAFVLLFGVSAVVSGKVEDAASGVTIGGSLLLGVLLSASFSGGVLNPAVAIATGTISFTYFLAPVVGGILAVFVYKFIQK